MNEADWETAYREVLTNGQRAACSVEEYAESEGEGLEALRETVGAGELGVIELNTDVVGNVGLVTGTIIYTARLGEQLETKGQVSGAGLVARRNLGTATAENPDYWVFEDGAWRWVQRRPDSPYRNGRGRRRLPGSGDVGTLPQRHLDYCFILTADDGARRRDGSDDGIESTSSAQKTFEWQ